MEYLVSAEEMRRADHCVIEEYGVTSLVLMERAALASVELMEREGFDLSRVLVVSGSGKQRRRRLCDGKDSLSERH